MNRFSSERLKTNKLVRSLLDDKTIKEEQLEKIAAAISSEKTSLIRGLLTNGVSHGKIFEHTKKIGNHPVFDLRALETPDDELRSLMSIDEMGKHYVFPMVKRNGILYVGVADPTDTQTLETLRFKSRAIIEQVLVSSAQFDALLVSMGGVQRESIQNAFVGTKAEDGGSVASDTVTIDITDGAGDSAAVVRFINGVLADAITKGASDLHFEPYEHVYRVRFRIDGVLQEMYSPPDNYRDQISARIKVIAQLDITERRIPQDGRIKVTLNKRVIDFRVSVLPTLWGEKIVMRILDSSAANLNIEILGFDDDQKQYILTAIDKPQGMILVTGPTGSGKTVTLYTCIGILNKPTTNISTAEDPVEINLEGINQVPVNPRVGLDFATALRAFLRQDPDIIMVGEIRDLETADIAIKAAQTGHLVLSTLHTNSAPETLTRLINMGVETFNIASTVHLIVAQRLARRLCKCKEQINIDTRYLERLGFTPLQTGAKIYGAVGCDLCNKGYKGRVGIYEVMPISDVMERLILEKASSVDIAAQAQKEGVNTLRQSAILKVVGGMTSVDEMLRVTSD